METSDETPIYQRIHQIKILTDRITTKGGWQEMDAAEKVLAHAVMKLGEIRKKIQDQRLKRLSVEIRPKEFNPKIDKL